MPDQQVWGRPDTGSAEAELAQTAVQEWRERQVAADALLADIEHRNDPMGPGFVRGVSTAELHFLYETVPEIENLADLTQVVERRKAALQNMLHGGSRQEIAEAEAEVEETKRLEADTEGLWQEIETADTSGEAIVTTAKEQIATVQSKLRERARWREQAEKELARRKSRYNALLKLAPKPLRDLVEARQNEVRQGENGKRLQKLRNKFSDLKQHLDNRSFGLLSGRGYDRPNDQTFVNFLRNEVPQAVIEPSSAGGQLGIDVKKVSKYVDELHAEKLPAMKEEIEQLDPQVEAELEAVRAPLHAWAETGVLTVEMLS